jgi:hypothetical protein
MWKKMVATMAALMCAGIVAGVEPVWQAPCVKTIVEAQEKAEYAINMGERGIVVQAICVELPVDYQWPITKEKIDDENFQTARKRPGTDSDATD